MITGFFLSILLTAVSFIVGLLPVIAFPAQITAGIVWFWSYVNLFSMVIPVQTIVTLIGVMTTYYVVKLLWQAFHWIMRRFKR